MELSHRAIVVLEQGSNEQFAQVESCWLFVLLDEAVEFGNEFRSDQVFVRARVQLVCLLV